MSPQKRTRDHCWHPKIALRYRSAAYCPRTACTAGTKSARPIARKRHSCGRGKTAAGSAGRWPIPNSCGTSLLAGQRKEHIVHAPVTEFEIKNVIAVLAQQRAGNARIGDVDLDDAADRKSTRLNSSHVA